MNPTGRDCPTKRMLFLQIAAQIGADEIRLNVHPDTDRDANSDGFALHDHPGIFSVLQVR